MLQEFSMLKRHLSVKLARNVGPHDLEAIAVNAS
jgi:hypothetical protein